MRSRAITGIVLTLLFTSVLTLASNVQDTCAEWYVWGPVPYLSSYEPCLNDIVEVTVNGSFSSEYDGHSGVYMEFVARLPSECRFEGTFKVNGIYQTPTLVSIDPDVISYIIPAGDYEIVYYFHVTRAYWREKQVTIENGGHFYNGTGYYLGVSSTISFFTIRECGRLFPRGTIWVEPDYVCGSAVGYGNTFTVEVKINITEEAGNPMNPGIYAFDYSFGWNDTLLELLSYNSYAPSDGVWEDGYAVAIDELRDIDANGEDDTHRYAVVAYHFPTAYYGVMTLADYTLNITRQPAMGDWEPGMYCLLGVTNYGFIDSNEDYLPMTEEDGIYEWHCTLSLGDLTFDGIIDIRDIRLCAKAFGCGPLDILWDPLADLKPDKLIDIFDLRKVAKNYGYQAP